MAQTTSKDIIYMFMYNGPNKNCFIVCIYVNKYSSNSLQID